MPDSQGNIRGISVSRLYPGHRDYQPEADEWKSALRELYQGALDDSMPGQALLDWFERHPWADRIVR